MHAALLLPLALALAHAEPPLTYEVFDDGHPNPQTFPARYTDVEGVLTFRGGPLRDGGAWGVAHVEKRELAIVWKATTGAGKAPWFGGAGWTGEPALVRWPKDVLAAMPVRVPPGSAEDFVEVIQGSLDGSVHFFDLKTGARTRDPIVTGNAIKGSVSVDARGWPLLFVGQGIPEGKPIGVHVYSLVTDKELFLLNGHDPRAPNTSWGAFDSSGLVNRDSDTFVVGGENGLVYVVKLNTAFDAHARTLTIAPDVVRYRYKHKATREVGIESSLAVLGSTAWWADDGGLVQALDLRTLTPLWSFPTGDDTDASVTVSLEDGAPMLYTGNELDQRGADEGVTDLRKLDGTTGAELWHRALPCKGMTEPRHEPGLFSTNALVDDLAIFMVSRCPTFAGGTLLALDKKTGKDVWRREMKFLAWPSTTVLHDQTGKAWLLQADAGGYVHLVDAHTGEIVFSLKLPATIEATPAIFDSRVVLATRGDAIYGLEIR